MSSIEYLLLTEDEIAKDLSDQAKRLRLKKNMTQKDFAVKAGIAYMTYCKFEQTGKISLIGFLKVLRHLGRLKEMSTVLEIGDIESVGLKEYYQENKEKKKRVRAHKERKESINLESVK